MIKLDEAQRLKDAGFEPGGWNNGDYVEYATHEFWGVNHKGEYSHCCKVTVPPDLWKEYWAAPNSDELIAAIQERWGGCLDCEIGLGSTWAEWCKTPDTNTIEVSGKTPTLLSALVDLYCKLAEGE